MRIQTNNPPPVQFGRLGKIKVGKTVLSESGQKIPSSTDYFIFTSDVPRRVAKIESLLMSLPENKAAGKIIVIPCTFPSNDDNVVCSQFLELRDTAGRVVAVGDGVEFRRSTADGWVIETGGKEYMAKLQAATPKGIWKECLLLRVFILGFDELGVWEFRSYGDDTTIPGIVSTFDSIKELAGRVRGIPFRLVVQKHSSNRAGVARQYPVVNLFCDFSPEGLDRIQSLGQNISGLITPEKLALPSPQVLAIGPEIFDEPETAAGFGETVELSADLENQPPEEVAKIFLSSYIFRAAGDYTDAAHAIVKAKLLTPEEREAAAKLLTERAKAAGFAWNGRSYQ
jgi:hypothetical protein